MEKLLEAPDESGYAVVENTTALSVQALDGGLSRSRLDELGGTRIVSLQWSGSTKRWQTVRDFFDTNLGLNCPQFSMDLQVTDGTYKEYICNIVPGTISTSTFVGLSSQITGQFEVIPRDDEIVTWPFPSVDGFDPALSFNMTLSGENNKTCRSIDPLHGAWAIHKNLRNTGKYYFEIQIDVIKFETAPEVGFGMTAIDGTFDPIDSGAFPIAGVQMVMTGQVGPGGHPTYPAFAPGDRVGVALDIDALSVWFSPNGVYLANHDPSNGSNPDSTLILTPVYKPWCGPVIAAQSTTTASGSGGTVFTRQDDFLYKIPAGFKPWDDNSLRELLYDIDDSTYSVADSNDRVNVNYGLAGGYRRNLLNGCVSVSASWTGDAEMYSYLAQAYRAYIATGGRPFLCNMMLDNKSMLLYSTEFLSFGLSQVQGETYTVTAQLSAQPANYDVATKAWIPDSGNVAIVLALNTAIYSLGGQAVNLILSATHFPIEAGIFAFDAKDITRGSSVASFLAQAASYSLAAQAVAFDIQLTPLKFNLQTGSYTLTSADMDNRTWVRMNVATVNVLTIPTQAHVPALIGTTVLFDQMGVGVTSIAPETGVTINHSRTFALAEIHSAGGITYLGSDTWELFGDLT